MFCSTISWSSSKENSSLNIKLKVGLGEEPQSHLGLYYPYGYLESQSASHYYGVEGLQSVITSLNFTHHSGADTLSQGESATNRSSCNLIGSALDDNNDVTFWPQFLQSCLPLLCETWLEVRPAVGDDMKRGITTNVKYQYNIQIR